MRIHSDYVTVQTKHRREFLVITPNIKVRRRNERHSRRYHPDLLAALEFGLISSSFNEAGSETFLNFVSMYMREQFFHARIAAREKKLFARAIIASSTMFDSSREAHCRKWEHYKTSR